MKAANDPDLLSQDALAGDSSRYWEDRARRFATCGDGLKAVCSYGMPAFYNRAIATTQTLALSRWLRVEAGTEVLEVGCGIGRWSLKLAARGARVTGIDLARGMIAEANRRAQMAGLADRCSFRVADITTLGLGRHFSFILCVTVLQHLTAPEVFDSGLARLAAHLASDGRLILLEAAPSRTSGRCDSPVFRARPLKIWLRAFERHDLELEAIHGVDPAPFRFWLLPHYRHLPPLLADATLASATALGIPVDLLLGRRLVRFSWHKVFVLRRGKKR